MSVNSTSNPVDERLNWKLPPASLNERPSIPPNWEIPNTLQKPE